MNRPGNFIIQAFATGGFLSYIPARIFQGWPLTGAGFVGSLLGLAALRYLPVVPYQQALVLVGTLLISIVISDRSEQIFRRTDDPRIIIDEFIGYWAAVAFLPRTVAVIWSAFVLFRLLDSIKPPPIRELGQLPGGWGIVMDDVLAGIVANLLIRTIPVSYWMVRTALLKKL
jgi:phosphatidylglycerophosphatase A